MNEILKLLQIREDLPSKCKYYFSAKDVAEYHNVSLNAVYASRQVKTDKLDKLMAFDKLQGHITVELANKIQGEL